MYKDKTPIKSFYSLQQAKIYCKEKYRCSLQTSGLLNVNYSQKLLFVRDDNIIDIHDFWETHQINMKCQKDKHKQQNKDLKGFNCYLYKDDVLIGQYQSIREAEKIAHHCFKKEKKYTYKNWHLKIY